MSSGYQPQGSLTSTKRHKAYHLCDCYGHEQGLPNYKVLAQPRTNNYYSATGGCPCIPRAAAHPGSWRLKAAQLRSSTHTAGVGCTRHGSVKPATRCCVHTGYQYGWKPGPHTVKEKNTAASGMCDTFGNMAFKSKSRNFLPAGLDDVSEVSSVSPQKLEDLETLILSEHESRRMVESDVAELQDIHRNGTQDLYKSRYEDEQLRKLFAQATETELHELLTQVRSISKRPLNQPNMDKLRRIVVHQMNLQKQRKDASSNRVQERREKLDDSVNVV